MDISKRILVTIVACAFFMEGLDATIINTALPQIALTLQTDPLHLKVALTAYLLAAGIFIPVSGWMADRFGCRTVFTTALLIFLLGSISCGLAQNLTELVIARIVQGIGGALSLPVGRLLFVRRFNKQEIASAMSLTATFGLLGPSCGPLIGGALTTYFNWRAIFFVNVPVGLIGFYFALKYIQNYKDPQIKKFDLLGFILLSVVLSCLLIGLDTLIDPIVNNFFTGVFLIGGVLGLFLYAFYARNREYALFSAALFKSKVFKLAVVGSTFIRLTIGAAPFLVPLLLQVEFGYTAMMSGVFTAASAVGMLLTKFFVTQTLQRYGHRLVLMVNSFLFAISTLMLSIIAWHPPMVLIFLLMLVNGVVASMQYTAMNTLGYSNIPKEVQASGSSFMSSFQQLMSSFSIAMAALVLQGFLQSRTILHIQSPLSFAKTFCVLAFLPLLSVWIFSKLPKNEKL